LARIFPHVTREEISQQVQEMDRYLPNCAVKPLALALGRLRPGKYALAWNKTKGWWETSRREE